MRRLVLSSVRHNRGRYIATLIAVITGVAFFAATGFLSDRVIDSLEGDVDREYGAVDVAIVIGDDDPDEESGHPIDDLTIAGKDADAFLSAPGVEAGAGELAGSVAFIDESGDPFAEDTVGRLSIEDEELNPFNYDEGELPAASEIAIDKGTAEDEGFSVGDEVTLLTLDGPQQVVISGIVSFGDSDSLDDTGTVLIDDENAFDWLNSGQVEYQAFYLRASGDPVELADALAPLTPDGFKAQEGEEFRAAKRDEVGDIGRVLKTGLQVFAMLALLVGGFVIYNTFSVVVAQRIRELAVLSAVGATPKQLKRSLRMEGLVLGVVGSAIGVAVGFLLTFLLGGVLSLAGVDLPGSGAKINSANVTGPLFAGILITVLSVTIPARRAAKTEPIEALRDASVESTEISRRRKITALALTGLGAAGLLAGGSGVAVGFGFLLFFLGVLVAGPMIAILGANLARGPMSRFGLEGRLAVDNSVRNPRRTATTSNALMIGVFLVTLVAVSGSSLKDFAVGEIRKLESADYLVESNGGSVDDDLVASFADVDGVLQVVPFRREATTINGVPQQLSSGDLEAMQEVADIEVAEGSLDSLGFDEIAILGAGDDGAVTIEGQALDAGLGDTVTVKDNSGETVELEVVALLEGSIDTSLIGSLVNLETFDQLVGDVAPTVAFIDSESGDQTDAKDAIEDVANLRPDITVTEGNALGRLIGGLFDFLINAVIGLLMMSVVIAMIGIVNTLSLSILERRRELGLLRVVGMGDERVQRMIRVESALISGLGTVTGLVAGAFASIALILSIDRLTEAEIAPLFPAVELVAILGAGVLLGYLAALIPAKRSTDLEVLDAINPS